MAVFGDGCQVVVWHEVGEAVVFWPVEVEAVIGTDPDAAGMVFEDGLDGCAA